MKKIFLISYARKNLGDDLFMKMLMERYPMHDFYMKIKKPEYLEYFSKYKNFHIVPGVDSAEELYNSDVNDYDAYVYIGGSIFMEGKKGYNLSEDALNFIKRCKENGKPFCYVSCNYGPYETEEYFNLSKKAFKTCTDICFRDRYSYELFQDIENARYAPDFVVTYPVVDEEKIKDSVGITVIDLNIREDLKDKENEYIEMLSKNIKEYINAGKKVYLYSFCKREGDENTIDKVVNKVNDDQNLIVVKYDGNIEEFLKIYAKMEYMICIRFHAMILSALTGQKMYIMSYSEKIDHVNNDLEFNIPTISVNDISFDTRINLNDFVSVERDKIAPIIEKAKQQEQAIQNILK